MRGKTGGRAVALPQVLDLHGSANEDLRFLHNFLMHDKKCLPFLTRKIGEWPVARLRMAGDIRSSTFFSLFEGIR